MPSQSSLISRFTYGNGAAPSLYALGYTRGEAIERELVQRSPRRQEALVLLAQRQIAAQEDAAREIAESSLACSHIISRELTEQANSLRDTIEQSSAALSDDLSAAISSAAGSVVSSIDDLDRHLAVEFGEMRWQLDQVRGALDSILFTLRRNRSNEARQLVEQGVRHYVNAEYQEAEERLRRALDYDTTDYQVLMNLGYIELQKENADAAITWFKKALSLPEGLDDCSKSRTLWAMARVCYTVRDYEKAIQFSTQSTHFDRSPDPKKLFTTAIYNCLADRCPTAMDWLEQSIRSDPHFFSSAATEPELESMRPEVFRLLSRFSAESLAKARCIDDEAGRLVESIAVYSAHPECGPYVAAAKQAYTKVRKDIDNLSYSECVCLIDDLSAIRDELKRATPIITEIDASYRSIAELSSKRKAQQVDQQLALKSSECLSLRGQLPAPVPPRKWGIGRGAWLAIVYLSPILGVLTLMPKLDVVLVYWSIAWPLTTPLIWLGAVIDQTINKPVEPWIPPFFRGLLLGMFGGLAVGLAACKWRHAHAESVLHRRRLLESKIGDCCQEIEKLRSEIADLEMRTADCKRRIAAQGVNLRPDCFS